MPTTSPSIPQIDWHNNALFLDFDGTLVEIIDDPAKVELSSDTRHALTVLYRRLEGALAIISGRDLEDLRGRLAPFSPALAGSHGIEQRDAAGRVRINGGHALDELNGLREPLQELAMRHGLLLERKTGALSLHFRNRPELETECRAFVAKLVNARPGLRVIHGNMVAEISLAGNDKGVAVAAFMKEDPFKGRLPVMVGDDTTDEDAFRAANDLGGFGVRIGSGTTNARYRIASTAQFLTWLQQQASGSDRGRI